MTPISDSQGAQAHRKGQRQGVDRHPQRLVVPSETAAQRGQCGADNLANDENLLAAIAQATGWRRRGDVIELTGAQTLRFRLMTN